MLHRSCGASIACALLLPLLAGCNTYPPYGTPQGYPGYMQPQPGGVMTLPPSNLGQPSPTPAGPMGSRWQPSASAPSNSSGYAPRTGAVPSPNNLDAPSPGDSRGKSNPLDDAPFGSDPSEEGSRLDNNGRRPTIDGANPLGEEDDEVLEAFQSPASARPTSAGNGQQVVTAAYLPTQPGQPNPYDYDRNEYRYLQGTAEYDERDRAWHVMYSPQPDEQDQFGGDIALAGHPGLKDLRNGDVIFVEGHVSADQRDSYGKPRYQIDHLQRVVPRQN